MFTYNKLITVFAALFGILATCGMGTVWAMNEEEAKIICLAKVENDDDILIFIVAKRVKGINDTETTVSPTVKDLEAIKTKVAKNCSCNLITYEGLPSAYLINFEKKDTTSCPKTMPSFKLIHLYRINKTTFEVVEGKYTSELEGSGKLLVESIKSKPKLWLTNHFPSITKNQTPIVNNPKATSSNFYFTLSTIFYSAISALSGMFYGGDFRNYLGTTWLAKKHPYITGLGAGLGTWYTANRCSNYTIKNQTPNKLAVYCSAAAGYLMSGYVKSYFATN